MVANTHQPKATATTKICTATSRIILTQISKQTQLKPEQLSRRRALSYAWRKASVIASFRSTQLSFSTPSAHVV